MFHKKIIKLYYTYIQNYNFYTQYLVSLMLCTMVVASRTSNLVAEEGLFFTMATCEIFVDLLKEETKIKNK